MSIITSQMPFGFENEFNGFGDRAVARWRFRCVVRCLFNFRNCVAHRNGEASAAHHGNIRKIIADIRDSRVGHPLFWTISS